MATSTSRIAGRLLTIAGAACLLPTGCKSASVPAPAQRASYEQVLNKYYEGRPMCVWDHNIMFPVVNAARHTIDDLGLDGLEDAGLVISKPGSKRATRTYVLTPEGKSALDPDVLNPGAGNFCYGRREVVSIEKARRNSSTTELVDYTYAVRNPASWASESSVQGAFPQIPSELGQQHTAEVTLLDTTDGWEVSGNPAIVEPRPMRQHRTVIAKLLHPRRRSG